MGGGFDYGEDGFVVGNYIVGWLVFEEELKFLEFGVVCFCGVVVEYEEFVDQVDESVGGELVFVVVFGLVVGELSEGLGGVEGDVQVMGSYDFCDFVVCGGIVEGVMIVYVYDDIFFCIIFFDEFQDV